MILYLNKSADNVIGKDLEEVGRVDIRLRADIDIYSPLIRLRRGFINFNYCYIEELNRYYFVKSFDVVGGFVNISMEVDLLESFKEDIKKLKGRLMRNVKNGDVFNGDLDMSLIKNVKTYDFDGDVELEDSIIISTVGV